MKTYVWILFALVVILIVSNLLNKQNDITTTCDTGDCDARTSDNPRLNTATIGACDPTTKTCKLQSTQKNKTANTSRNPPNSSRSPPNSSRSPPNSSRNPPADFNDASTKESGVFSPVYDTDPETKARPDNLEVY